MKDLKETILDFIDDNKEKTKFIKTFALENQITYDQAKEIFKKRYSKTYYKINTIAEKYEVPQELIISMIYEDGLDFSQIDDDSINKKIYEDYVKEDNKDLQFLIDYSGYIKEIRKICLEFDNIPAAIEDIQIRIKEFSEDNNVNTIVSTLCVCYNLSIEEAKKVEYILSYNEKNNIERSSDIWYDYMNYLTKATELKRVVLHGITIVSPTNEGLNYLIDIVKKAFLYGAEDYKIKLEQLSKEHNLILTNYHYKDSLASSYENRIYLSNDLEDDLEHDLVNTFYHESTHFMDYYLGTENKHYSVIDRRVKELFNRIKVNINCEPYKLITSNSKIPRSLRLMVINYSNDHKKGIINKGRKYKKLDDEGLADKYINDSVMIEKWRKEIIDEYAPETKEELTEYLFQKRLYERNKYLRLISIIYDIYDAMVEGVLYDDYNLLGHGIEYYERKGLDLIEFMAEIGIFFNNDCMDVLIYEFGEEITKELMDIYREMLEKSKEQYDGKHNTNNDETMKVA